LRVRVPYLIIIRWEKRAPLTLGAGLVPVGVGVSRLTLTRSQKSLLPACLLRHSSSHPFSPSSFSSICCCVCVSVRELITITLSSQTRDESTDSLSRVLRFPNDRVAGFGSADPKPTPTTRQPGPSASVFCFSLSPTPPTTSLPLTSLHHLDTQRNRTACLVSFTSALLGFPSPVESHPRVIGRFSTLAPPCRSFCAASG
jgi:hypothetical protein